ncbi:hypothetical protein BDQ17DRAFT_1537561 [Cyathus striatus]|nr:hypothetical protein BDQ17DRAFT_1537561 [Cyathus striatus]
MVPDILDVPQLHRQTKSHRQQPEFVRLRKLNIPRRREGRPSTGSRDNTAPLNQATKRLDNHRDPQCHDASFGNGARDVTLKGTTIVNNVAGHYTLIHEIHVRPIRPLVDGALRAGFLALMFMIAVMLLYTLAPFRQSQTGISIDVWKRERAIGLDTSAMQSIIPSEFPKMLEVGLAVIAFLLLFATVVVLR